MEGLSIAELKAKVQMGENRLVEFKSEMYKLSEEKDKAEFIKDIIAMANVLTRSPGFIFIGVMGSARSRIKGISGPIHDDAAFQQMVNSKVNRPIQFIYYEMKVDRKRIGIFRIEPGGRPFFLKTRFLSLNSNIVYFRQGTATETANPDQLFSMLKEDLNVHNGDFRLYFHDSMQVEDNDLTVISINANAVKRKSLNELFKPKRTEDNLAGMLRDSMYDIFGNSEIIIIARNEGEQNLQHLRIVCKIECPAYIFEIQKSLKKNPKQIVRRGSMKFNLTHEGDEYKLVWSGFSGLPKFPIRLTPFYIRTNKKLDLSLNFEVYAENLPNPILRRLNIRINHKKNNVA